MIKSALENKNFKLELLYRGRKDGFDLYEFHTQCNKKGPTLSVIQAYETYRIFGGFISIDLDSSQKEGQSCFDQKAFLYSQDD